MQSLAELNENFGIPDVLRFEEAGALIHAVISTPVADATLYLQGAHLATWQPKGQRPVLFVSSRSMFAPGKVIRGGVPVIFPWFAARRDGRPGPSHGFARTSVFTVQSASLSDKQEMLLELLLKADDASHTLGFDGFEFRVRVSIGETLHMELETRNDSAIQLHFEEALHSYFSVSDVREVSVTGLENTAYLDRAAQEQRREEPPGALRFTAETDRLFLNTESTCTIHDPHWQRSIVIEKSGSRSTVVWNPWVEKASQLADLGSDQWPSMLCVETANAVDNAVTLEPGEVHRMTARVRVEAAL